MLFSLFKNHLFFQNIASALLSKVPPTVEHNLGKYQALRKAWYLTSLDHTRGDYYEFGIFTGSSFVMSMRLKRQLKWLDDHPITFFGFDSFQGFGDIQEIDSHPFFKNEMFSVNKKKVLRNIRKKAKREDYSIIEGFFETTLPQIKKSDHKMGKAKIIFIDCDLYIPAKSALEFASDLFQTGTILLMDDFFSYQGRSDKGIYAAFEEFRRKNPKIHFRKLLNYGYGGVGYIAEIREQ